MSEDNDNPAARLRRSRTGAFSLDARSSTGEVKFEIYTKPNGNRHRLWTDAPTYEENRRALLTAGAVVTSTSSLYLRSASLSA